MSNAGASRFGSVNTARREVCHLSIPKSSFSDGVVVNTGNNLKLPVTTLSYNINPLASGLQENLLLYRDGTPYLSKYKVEDEDNFFVCASPLDKESNDLVFNAEIFVPLVV